MFRLGVVLLICFSVGCKDKEASVAEEKSFSYESLVKIFPEKKLPLTITDTGLLRSTDTTQVRWPEFAKLIPDTLKQKTFPKATKLRYYALGRMTVEKGETYFLVNAVSANKRAAYLICYNPDHSASIAFPFLIPDADPATSQQSSMDKSYTVSRSVIRRKGNEIAAEGKDVFVYNKDAGQFTLIMTDPLDEKNAELINPIDTLPHMQKFSGDYTDGKRNLISIRDGRSPRQALAFVHLEKNNGECTGELKGDILFTSTTTAVYRQGGDPCVLQFIFSGSSVQLKEEEGCGNHRGLNCAFEGSFRKKKEVRAKPAPKGKK